MDRAIDTITGLTRNPDQIIKHASAFFQDSRTRHVAAAAAGAVTLYQASKCLKASLTYRNVNNGVTLPKFEPSQEIAVITGGCGGIGWRLAGDLLKKGLKGVAILDIQEPQEPLPGECKERTPAISEPWLMHHLNV